MPNACGAALRVRQDDPEVRQPRAWRVHSCIRMGAWDNARVQVFPGSDVGETDEVVYRRRQEEVPLQMQLLKKELR